MPSENTCFVFFFQKSFLDTTFGLPLKDLFQADLKFYRTVAATCNVFRELTDKYDSWDSVIGEIDYFGDDPGNFSAVAGPGTWNDPDQVETRNLFFSYHSLIFVVLFSAAKTSMSKTLNCSSKVEVKMKTFFDLCSIP